MIKINDKREALKITCKIIAENINSEFDTASGEHLDAVEAYNEKWQVYLGTEDSEVMYSRILENDWLPIRFKSEFSFHKSMPTYLDGYVGFETKIPPLKKNENVHVQYLSAIDVYDGEGKNINSWIAVNEFKKDLENRIGIPSSLN